MKFVANIVRASVSLSVAAVVVIHMGCTPSGSDNVKRTNSVDATSAAMQSRKKKYKAKLSDYGLFQTPFAELIPSEGVFEYQLNTPLFSDYSQKHRVIKLPEGTSAKYKPDGPLDFPVGTIIAKTFYYQADLNDAESGRQIIETRILEHLTSGWVGIPYIWNEEQSDALLAIAGDEIDVSWKHTDGKNRSIKYAVPNLNDCKRCHEIMTMQPIGPKANNLNCDVNVANGASNQLKRWASLGIIEGLPAKAEIPRLANWENTEYSVDERARAYLDVNCAHCHNPNGPARNSGLHLNVQESKPYHLGTFKSPVAAGKGTGGRIYGIVPGKPDESILEYRLRTTEPGEIMPEFGKSLVHEEGLSLIRQWILEMK